MARIIGTPSNDVLPGTRGNDEIRGGASDDIGGLPKGQVMFATGAAQASTSIAFDVSGDTTFEPNEDFQVELTVPAGTPGGTTFVLAQVKGTIKNDDAQVPARLAITPEALAQDEGDSATTAYTFTVTRSGNTAGQTTVDFSNDPMSANATAPIPPNPYLLDYRSNVRISS